MWRSSLIVAIGMSAVLAILPRTAHSIDSTPMQLTPEGIHEPPHSQPTSQSGAMNPYERAQEAMRRLNLPPDPKLKERVDQAFAARNACFEKAMRPLIRKGLRVNDLAEAACHACAKQVVAAATVFFEANKHRYMEPNLEAEIKQDQENCSLYASSLALEMPDRMAEEVRTKRLLLRDMVIGWLRRN